MEIAEFRNLPADSQVWVFAFERPLAEADRLKIEAELDRFLPTWASHQTPVTGAYRVLEDRFVLVAAHAEGGLSGCSKDSCVANFKRFKAEHGLNAFDRNLVFYRDDEGRVQALGRQGFQKKLDRGELNSETTVFDTTIQELAQLDRLEKKLDQSWHGRAFRIPV